jgi:hypothetical protein
VPRCGRGVGSVAEGASPDSQARCVQHSLRTFAVSSSSVDGQLEKHASLSALPKDVVPPTEMAAGEEESCGQVVEEKTQESGQESGGHGAAAKKKFDGPNSSSARLRVKRAACSVTRTASYFSFVGLKAGGGGARRQQHPELHMQHSISTPHRCDTANAVIAATSAARCTQACNATQVHKERKHQQQACISSSNNSGDIGSASSCSSSSSGSKHAAAAVSV